MLWTKGSSYAGKNTELGVKNTVGDATLLTLKRNELLRRATTWMNPRGIVLSERRQLLKRLHYTIPCI